MDYKHIVFDIDGTLIDTEYAVINSLIKTITEITGRAPQYESLKFALGITGRNALELVLAIYKSAATGRPVELPLKECASIDFAGRFDDER